MINCARRRRIEPVTRHLSLWWIVGIVRIRWSILLRDRVASMSLWPSVFTSTVSSPLVRKIHSTPTPDSKMRFSLSDMAVVLPTKIPPPCLEQSHPAKFLAEERCRAPEILTGLISPPYYCLRFSSDERDGGVKPLIIMASPHRYEIRHNSYLPFGT